LSPMTRVKKKKKKKRNWKNTAAKRGTARLTSPRYPRQKKHAVWGGGQKRKKKKKTGNVEKKRSLWKTKPLKKPSKNLRKK